MEEINIRNGIREDLQAVHRLVQELAVYERAPDAVTATAEDYRRDFDQGIFELQVAETDDAIVGMALYYMTYSTWKGRMLYLEDFYVRAEYRRKGIGKRLFDAFMDVARQKKCRLVKWQVLDWNEPALSFYKKIGAEIETDWYNGKLYLDQYDR